MEFLIPWKSADKDWQKKSNLKTRIKSSKANLILKQIKVMSCFEVQIDQASNNVAITCKRYNVEAILKEIDTIGHGN